jgi:hypothetical protein
MEPIKKNENSIIVSYLNLRRAIGFLGILLPIAVVSGALIYGSVQGILPSISDYYYSSTREIFVATLCVMGAFMLSYNGYDIRDIISSKICGFAAFGIAFFPTPADAGVIPCLSLIKNAHLAGIIHFSCAGILFLTFSYMSIFLFRKTSDKANMSEQKKKRNEVYKYAGLAIITCILLVAVYKIFLTNTPVKNLDPIFWLEVVMLWAFGISWIVKGNAILADQKE